MDDAVWQLRESTVCTVSTCLYDLQWRFRKVGGKVSVSMHIFHLVFYITEVASVSLLVKSFSFGVDAGIASKL